MGTPIEDMLIDMAREANDVAGDLGPDDDNDAGTPAEGVPPGGVVLAALDGRGTATTVRLSNTGK